MNKILIQSSLIVVIFLGFLLSTQVSHGSDIEEGNIFIGEKAEEIDGMLHRVEYLYGSSIYKSLDNMLDGLKVLTYKEDKISFFPDPAYGLGSKIIIKRATPIEVNDSGNKTIYRTWKTTIKEFLEEKNIVIGEKDLLSINLDTKLTDFAYNRDLIERDGRETNDGTIGSIVITRVNETEIKEKESIDFKTIIKKDPNLEKGKTVVENQGKKGIKELTYLIRREDGKEISKKLIKSEVIENPIDKVIIEGTEVLTYGTGKATWYSLIGGMTAAHNTLPFGTMVHVVNVENGKSVDVKIVDRGIQGSAIIDLSDEAFEKIAPLGKGVTQVRLEQY